MWATDLATQRIAQADADRYQASAARVRRGLPPRFDPYVAALRGARGFITGNRQGGHEAWRGFVLSQLDRRHLPALRALGWAPALAPMEIAGFLAAAHADGDPDFQIEPRGYWPEYRPVRFMEPVARTRGAVGHDLAAVPAAENAMKVARETGTAQLTEPLDPAFGEVGWSSVALVLPVYRPDGRGTCAGWVIAVLDVAKLVRQSVAESPELAISVYDGETLDPERMLYHDPRHAVVPSAGEIRPVVLFGQSWLVGLTRRPEAQHLDHATGPLLTGVGWVVTALIFVCTWMAGGRAAADPPGAPPARASVPPLPPREPRRPAASPPAPPTPSVGGELSPAAPLPVVRVADEAPTGLRILLVEADTTTRGSAAADLECAGHTVTAVAEGADAVARVAQEPFDVVLLEVQMPGMHGFEAAAAIRAEADQPFLIALIAAGHEPDVSQARAAGFDAALAAPIDPAALLDLIERLAAEGGRTVGGLWALSPAASRRRVG